MEYRMMRYPFEATPEEFLNNPEPFVDAIFASLESDFLILPKGNGFVEYTTFENGYELLKAATHNFSAFSPDNIYAVAVQNPIILVVLRTMMGFTPPEWAYLASHRTQISVSQNYARSLDRKIRMSPETPLQLNETAAQRLMALVQTACQLLEDGAPDTPSEQIHRLDKVDTKTGIDGIHHVANMGVPYAMLLYERLLGRPFAGHRDSVSELIGDRLEMEIERLLTRWGVSFRKTKRAERIDGFDQAPDFIIPSEFNPQVVIEAKITEDDGTARDKVTRIQHLAEISASSHPKFEVIACIGGRGFGVRREDMKKLLIATQGKVFTMSTLDHMIEHTRLKKFSSL
jgi:hypothetical protein